MATRYRDMKTRALLKLYGKSIRKHFKLDEWISTHSSWRESYASKVDARLTYVQQIDSTRIELEKRGVRL